MDIEGSWHMLVGRTYLHPDVDRASMSVVRFGDGRITLEDGTHPPFRHTTTKGHATLSFDQRSPGGDFVRIVIDRGGKHLQGHRFEASAPLPDELDLASLPDGVRWQPVVLIRSDDLNAAEAEGMAMAGRASRVLH